MQVLGITWLGIRTIHFNEMLTLFRDTMGLDEAMSEAGFTVLTAENGDIVELFGPNNGYNLHFGDAPVAGFAVADFRAALRELESAGYELVHVHADDVGRSWAHFRAPDNNLYEITG